jgi:hypothetical protein
MLGFMDASRSTVSLWQPPKQADATLATVPCPENSSRTYT